MWSNLGNYCPERLGFPSFKGIQSLTRHNHNPEQSALAELVFLCAEIQKHLEINLTKLAHGLEKSVDKILIFITLLLMRLSALSCKISVSRAFKMHRWSLQKNKVNKRFCFRCSLAVHLVLLEELLNKFQLITCYLQLLYN